MKWQYSALLENYFQTSESENTVTFFPSRSNSIHNCYCQWLLQYIYKLWVYFWLILFILSFSGLFFAEILACSYCSMVTYIRSYLKSNTMWRFVILFTNDSVNFYSNIEVGNPQYKHKWFWMLVLCEKWLRKNVSK